MQVDEDVMMLARGLEGFNKIMVLCSFLKNFEVPVNKKQLLVGGHRSDERLIHYLIVCLLCSHALNHA